MIRLEARWLLAAVLWLALLSACDSQNAERATTDTEVSAMSWDERMRAGRTAYQQGHYAEAERQFDVGLEQAERFGGEDPRLGTSLNNLAQLYQAQGRYAEAEPLYQRALAILEKTLGPDHPDVATNLNNLAGLYHVQGRYDWAEPLYQRSLAIWEKGLGPEHPHVATSLENYAALLRKTEREDKAKEMEARAKAIRVKYE